MVGLFRPILIVKRKPCRKVGLFCGNIFVKSNEQRISLLRLCRGEKMCLEKEHFEILYAFGQKHFEILYAFGEKHFEILYAFTIFAF